MINLSGSIAFHLWKGYTLFRMVSYSGIMQHHYAGRVSLASLSLSGHHDNKNDVIILLKSVEGEEQKGFKVLTANITTLCDKFYYEQILCHWNSSEAFYQFTLKTDALVVVK